MNTTAPPVRCGDHLDISVGARPALAGARGFRRVAGSLFSLQVGGTLPIPLYVLWQQRFGFGTGTLTLIFAAYSLGTLVSLLALAPLSDQLGRRPALVAAIALAMLSTVAFLLAASVAALAVARVLSGMAVGLATPTGTAALRELEPGGRGRPASLTASALTLGGLGAGPLLAGFAAQYGHDPTRLVFWLYLAALVPALAAVLASADTVPRRTRIVWRPRGLALPGGAHGEFALAAGAVFCAFTVFGLFSSLVPSFLADSLHERNHAIAGGVAAAVFLTATAAQLALNGMTPQGALRVGLPLVIAGLGLVELALWTASFAVLACGTIASGAGCGLSFMGATAIVNQIAPPERRAEVLAAYFACAYAGVAIPAVAVGVLSDEIGVRDATLTCALATAALATILRSIHTMSGPSRITVSRLRRGGSR
jgi:MFS family permease